jgi:hypothetical protein
MHAEGDGDEDWGGGGGALVVAGGVDSGVGDCVVWDGVGRRVVCGRPVGWDAGRWPPSPTAGALVGAILVIWP